MYSLPHGGGSYKKSAAVSWMVSSFPGFTKQMVGLAAMKLVRDPEQHHRGSMQMKSQHSVHSSVFSIFRSYNVGPTTCQTDQQKCGHLGRTVFSQQQNKAMEGRCKSNVPKISQAMMVMCQNTCKQIKKNHKQTKLQSNNNKRALWLEISL